MTLKQKLSMTLALALLLAPSLSLLAEEGAAVPVSASADSTAAASTVTASKAPDLPEIKGVDANAPAPEDVTGTAAPEVPKDIIPMPGAIKPDVPESPFKWGNFGLGFVGGALVGGAAGLLFLSKGDDGSFDPNKAAVMGPAVGAGTGLLFGLAALFLGTTTPEKAKPPKVESKDSLLPGPSATQVADLGVRLDWRF